MMRKYVFNVLFILAAGLTASAQTSEPNRLLNMQTVDDYLSICLDGQLHKTVPGPESELYDLCTPWKEWSCCTTESSKQLHTNATWYKFSWDHCDGTLSTQCRRYFQQDLCFYECSPNVGPWLVQENRRWRNERFYKVPLCKSECDEWYEACKDDFTCVENWSTDFQWSAGHQHCPVDATTSEQVRCRKISEVYRDSEHFCEKVWDDSWDVVPDHQSCMMLDFEPGLVTNNANVARLQAQKLIESRSVVDAHSSTTPRSYPALTSTSIVMLLLLLFL